MSTAAHAIPRRTILAIKTSTDAIARRESCPVVIAVDEARAALETKTIIDSDKSTSTSDRYPLAVFYQRPFNALCSSRAKLFGTYSREPYGDLPVLMLCGAIPAWHAGLAFPACTLPHHPSLKRLIHLVYQINNVVQFRRHSDCSSIRPQEEPIRDGKEVKPAGSRDGSNNQRTSTNHHCADRQGGFYHAERSVTDHIRQYRSQ